MNYNATYAVNATYLPYNTSIKLFLAEHSTTKNTEKTKRRRTTKPELEVKKNDVFLLRSDFGFDDFFV